MSIRDELSAELRDAMRAGDAPRRNVIRQIETEVTTARAAPGFSGEVDDDLYRLIITGYVKKMRKAVEEYEGLGERGAAMADRLRFEVEYLTRWLPSVKGEEETRQIVRAAIAELGVGGDPKAAGRVTGHVMQRSGSELDGSLVNRVVRDELEEG